MLNHDAARKEADEQERREREFAAAICGVYQAAKSFDALSVALDYAFNQMTVLKAGYVPVVIPAEQMKKEVDGK
jgi:hypothetical protein